MMKRLFWYVACVALGLLLAGAIVGLVGCDNYREHWEDYDRDHTRCRSTRPHFLTGSVDTVCENDERVRHRNE